MLKKIAFAVLLPIVMVLGYAILATIAAALIFGCLALAVIPIGLVLGDSTSWQSWLLLVLDIVVCTAVLNAKKFREGCRDFWIQLTRGL